MARNDDLLKGVAIGLGVVVVVPVVIAALAPVVRPMARSALKAGIRAYERGREKVEEFGETMDDIVAEDEEEMIVARELDEASEETDEQVADTANG